MGQSVKKTKSEVQLQRLKNVIVSMLQANENLMTFHKSITTDPKAIKVYNKSIKESRKAMVVISQVKHIDILTSLYNALISGKESYFAIFGSVILAKNKVVYWDKTEKGYKEFLKLEAEAKAKSKQEYEEKLKQQELVNKAKAEGKKVEFSYENGKLKPLIVEDKPN